jgi:diphthine-ammonia ligase
MLFLFLFFFLEMKVIALISGGKDSTFNMMECIKNGHEIVALLNLRPPKSENNSKHELDSYMYQTVGNEILDLYAEAMQLPFYRADILGTTKNIDLEYEPTCEDDEVEDLYRLVKFVQEELLEKNGIKIEAISSGAILSTYQKNRVENVCKRLGLESLAYLWSRNQQELLDDMICSGIDAILIKVACLGLEPNKHLGKSLVELRPYLYDLQEKFGINMCGEGGEYESLTLNCPLFKKKICVDDYEIVIHSNDAFAKVGYLKLNKFHLEEMDKF